MNSLQKLIFFSAAAVLGFGILTPVSTKAATFSDLSITVAETGLWSRTIVDGGEGDTDGVVNNKISIDFLPKNQSPFSFMVSSIDPKEPVVIAEATAKSVKLILTNLLIEAVDDLAKGTITFGGNWMHDEGDGQMNVSLNGSFRSGIDSNIPDKYEIDLTGKVANNELMIGTFTGPKNTCADFQENCDTFRDSKSKEISLTQATDEVKGILKFSLDRNASALTIPTSASVAAVIVPEPSSLLGLVAVGSLGLTLKRKKQS